ncbi:hypothetical protein JW848_07635, partial [Candidatus Bipolaricaulota bacterium]|nr:hypothetical protein [Candidatus Bipolaricaulota bacterium]
AVSRAADTAQDNTLQVAALSGNGVELRFAPSIAEASAAQSVDARSFVRQMLDSFALMAGLDPEDRPADERWIFLEFAAGDPRYDRRTDDQWPAGIWREIDTEIDPSAFGMGLAAQATLATKLSQDETPVSRYLALVLSEVMASKIDAMGTMLPSTTTGGGRLYFRAYERRATATGSSEFDARVTSVDLADQVALILGLQAFVRYAETAGWARFAGSAAAVGLDRSATRAQAMKLLDELWTGVTTFEAPGGARLAGLISAAGTTESLATIEQLGLLASVLAAESRDSILGPWTDQQQSLLRQISEELLGTQRTDGMFERISGEAPGSTLTAQASGVLGLASAYAALGGESLLAAARNGLEHLGLSAWDAELGLFRSEIEDDGTMACLTPEEIAVVVSTVDAMIPFLSSEDARLWTLRTAKFVETVTVALGLQLSYAIGSGSFGTFPATASRIYTPVRVPDADEGVASVFQASLCIERGLDTGSCCGAVTDIDPWFDTASGMYAGYEIQAEMPALEEMADASLYSVVLYSGLGVPVGPSAAQASESGSESGLLEEIIPNLVGELGADLTGLDLIGLEYESGSPRLFEPTGFVWSEETFFDRVTGASLGMSLAREAQEAVELLTQRRGPYYGATPEQGAAGLLFLIAAVEKIPFIEDVLARLESEKGAAYFPHAIRLRDGDREIFDVVDPVSELRDLASLLLGLGELRAGIGGPLEQAAHDLEIVPEDLVTRIDQSIVGVLDILMERHHDSARASFVRTAWIGPDGWEDDGVIDAVSLGLLANGLVAVRDTAAPGSKQHAESQAAIDEIAGFVRDQWQLDDAVVDFSELESIAGAMLALAIAGDPQSVEAAAMLFERLRDELVLPTRIETACGTSEWIYADVGAARTCFSAWEVALITASVSRLADLADSASEILMWRDRFVGFALEKAGLSLVYGAWPACGVPSFEGGGIRFAPVIARTVCIETVP